MFPTDLDEAGTSHLLRRFLKEQVFVETLLLEKYSLQLPMHKTQTLGVKSMLNHIRHELSAWENFGTVKEAPELGQIE